ncbi:MAG: polysaccharide pyruvyl transferase family protein [Candidatus Gastranaerophilaceae bacterium]
MKNIKVFYWLGEPNFGDMLNIDICREIFNINPVETCPEDCEAVFIGSVLDDFLYKHTFKYTKKFQNLYNQEPIRIWGSGFITSQNKFVKRKFNLPETYFRRFQAYAVRGLESRNRLEAIQNQKLNNVPLGDPGLLASLLLKKQPTKKYKIGIIPHHLELNMAEWNILKENIKDSVIIRVNDSPLKTIEMIAQCETIISSAMHGLIVADSFNIPNIRIVASNKLIGGDYKFNDYYSAYNLTDNKYLILGKDKIDDNIHEFINNNYRVKKCDVNKIKDSLLNSFPYMNQ